MYCLEVKWGGYWTLIGQYLTRAQAVRIMRDYQSRGETVRVSRPGSRVVVRQSGRGPREAGMASKRAVLVRNAKRCLADLFGGHVWKYSLARVREAAHYVLDVRRDALARDEVVTLSVFAAEYTGREGQGSPDYSKSMTVGNPPTTGRAIEASLIPESDEDHPLRLGR